jgi:hypothetical protein
VTLRAELDEIELEEGQSCSRRSRARACGLEVIGERRGDSVIPALCRKLIEAGHDASSTLEAYRGETLAICIRSIGWIGPPSN